MRVLLLAMAGLALGPAASAQAPAPPPVRITYLTGSSAYIDAGRQDGLHEGDSLQVLRGGARVGSLRVSYLASRQAACEILDQTAPLVVGDTVDLARRAEPPPVAADTAAAGQTRAAGRRAQGSSFGLRGRIGARYLGVWQRDAVRTHFSQPSLDLRLDGEGLGGAPVGIMLDVRTRRTATARPDGTTVADGRTRVYRGGLVFGAPEASPFTAGRQYSAAVSSVSLFDGGRLSRLPSWGGSFGGSEPEPWTWATPARFGIMAPGSAAQPPRRRPVLVRHRRRRGLVHPGRDQPRVSLRQGLRRPTLLVLPHPEIDHYRAWKQAIGESPGRSPAPSARCARGDPG
jgi:hypothetical protein